MSVRLIGQAWRVLAIRKTMEPIEMVGLRYLSPMNARMSMLTPRHMLTSYERFIVKLTRAHRGAEIPKSVRQVGSTADQL